MDVKTLQLKLGWRAVNRYNKQRNFRFKLFLTSNRLNFSGGFLVLSSPPAEEYPKGEVVFQRTYNLEIQPSQEQCGFPAQRLGVA